MDIEVFSSPDFDCKAWVNSILKNEDRKDQSTDYVMGTAMKLQLYVQQINKSLENINQQTLASLPKILRETKSLQQEAITLKAKMKQVKEDVGIMEQETRKSIDSIEKLESMKNQLISVKQGLQEADNWIVLVNDLEDVFESKNIESILGKILSMQSSLKLLVDVVDYEDRKMQLEGLKNRLEAVASPLIVQAFISYDTDQSLFFVNVFSSMGRLPELIKYYSKCQKDILLKKWRDQLDVDQDDSVIQWMENYYNMLLSNWHAQLKWFNQTFKGGCATTALIDVYVSVLNSLDPSLNECIDAALKQVHDKLVLLKDVKDTTKHFADSMMSIIQKPTVDNIKVEALLKAIFAHLVNYVSNYAAYEQANLNAKLSLLNCMKEELPDTIQSLGLSITKVIDLAKDAKKRCKEITENYGICGLLEALRGFLTNYAGYYRIALRQIDRSKRVEEDWTTFQLCFSLLQHSGTMLLKIQELENEITTLVLQLNKTDSSADYKSYLLNTAQLKEYNLLVKYVTEGMELSLLDHITQEFTRLSADIHHTTYQVVFGPISVQLATVQSTETWSNFDATTLHSSDLPDYSFSPQEYITQIGQYLMTLPQHLEPFLFRENPPLSCALKSVDQEYATAPDSEGALVQVFLKIVARHMCNAFCDKIVSICRLSQAASRQLAHDINYLNSILQDLGITMSENLQQLSLLLKIPSDQYQTQSIGCSARYVAAVRQMRNITSN